MTTYKCPTGFQEEKPNVAYLRVEVDGDIYECCCRETIALNGEFQEAAAKGWLLNVEGVHVGDWDTFSCWEVEVKYAR